MSRGTDCYCDECKGTPPERPAELRRNQIVVRQIGASQLRLVERLGFEVVLPDGRRVRQPDALDRTARAWLDAHTGPMTEAVREVRAALQAVAV